MTPKPRAKAKRVKRPRKPRNLKFEKGQAGCFDDEWGRHVSIDVQSLPLSKARKLAAWLTRAIAYLEWKEKQG